MSCKDNMRLKEMNELWSKQLSEYIEWSKKFAIFVYFLGLVLGVTAGFVLGLAVK